MVIYKYVDCKQMFVSLIACGIKLSLSLVVLVLMQQYRLQDCSRQYSLILFTFLFVICWVMNNTTPAVAVQSVCC